MTELLKNIFLKNVKKDILTLADDIFVKRELQVIVSPWACQINSQSEEQNEQSCTSSGLTNDVDTTLACLVFFLKAVRKVAGPSN